MFIYIYYLNRLKHFVDLIIIRNFELDFVSIRKKNLDPKKLVYLGI